MEKINEEKYFSNRRNSNMIAKFGLCLHTDKIENFANIENRKFSISLKTGNF